jgi:hypothetical protein
MKLKATSLFLGICLAALAGAASPAYARSTTAFSAFHVWPSAGKYKGSPYLCLSESYGAVVNNCTFAVGLEFDLPVDDAGTITITVQNYWGGTDEEETFSCGSYAYAGSSGTDINGSQIDFTAPAQSFNTSVDVKDAMSLQVVCPSVPPGGGVANFNWNP